MAPPVVTTLVAFTLFASAPSRPVLVVDPGRDSALSCGANQALGDALSLVLPDVPVVQRASDDPQALFAALSFEEGGWRFWLSRADGSVPLSRRLEGAAEDCVAVANASAVIVDRYFSDVVWPGEAVQVAPLRPPPPFVRSLSVGAGGSMRAPVETALGFGVEVVGSARLGRLGVLQLGAWRGPSDSVAVVIDGRDRGSLHATHYAAWLGGGACFGAVDAASVCGGAFTGAWMLDAWADGNLFQKRAVRPVAPQVGFFGMGVQPLGRSFEVALSVRSGVLLSRPVIGIEGTDAALRAPAVDVEAGLRFGWKNLF